jgi:hypothetical protein
VLSLVLFAVAILLPLLRQTGARSWDTIWAEDSHYVSDAATAHAPQRLLAGYAGYAQFAPRLISVPLQWLPIERSALYLAVASATWAALLALFVYRALRSQITSPWLRLVPASLCVLAPVLLFENTANLTNSIWVLLFAAFVAVMSADDGAGLLVARCAIVFLAVTSLPMGALLLPLAGLTAVVRRRKADCCVLGALASGTLVQAVIMASTHDATPAAASRATDLPAEFSVRVLGSLLIGDGHLDHAWRRLGLVAALAFGALALGIAVGLLRCSSRPARQLAVVAAMYAVGLFVLPVWIRGSAGMRLVDGVYNQAGSRYAVAPVLLLATAAAALADGSGRRWVRGLVVGHTAVVIILSLFAANFRSIGPRWTDSVAEQRAVCTAQGVATVRLGVSPGGWYAEVPCRTLR